MHAYVGLGSNLGDRWSQLRDALARLARRGLVADALSSVWETEGVDTPAACWFLNMVIRLRTDLAPADLLGELLAVEAEAGRVRSVPNAPRTLDLDLLLLDRLVLQQPGLELPHPRMWQRSFVLEPLAEIAPDLADPRGGGTVDEQRRRIAGRSVVRRVGRLAPPEALLL